ncbi:molybdopterin-binding/glycosyltransferase family 2 protein [Hyphomicrobium sp. CS1BSMeth3]|uniref:NTP transferase domain-containing protein n=1 Tax=Hyphomicrobium sp. CS1BSMeth3 TaxID=1892844 RepID=UPI000931D38A|nr:molybdopterin-binding/glycosyltransferase family 2 protein [Hyphomicrobium sp. CS1BSMeth3]
MKFEQVPLRAASGAILAHSIPTPSGAIKKGRVLGADEIARLEAAGIESVTAALLEAGDVGEDAAAARVAAALCGSAMHVAEPFTGRANLYADASGLVEIDAARLGRLNSLDEGLTVATVSAFERVTRGQMIATVKVITFALPEAVVSAAETLAREAGGLMHVRAFRAVHAGLVLTQLPGTRKNLVEKRRRAIAQRLEALGSEIGASEVVAHETGAVAAAISRMAAAGHDPIIVFAASAIVDRQDVIPAGLVAAGGAIERLGMPVDPGNLMLLGRLDKRDVIGAPSCAASPKINGFDWVLERRLAGIAVTSADVASMGLGGLLKEIVTRPQPREVPPDEDANADSAEVVRRAPRIASVVLAGGRSTRYGQRNKLLEMLDGAPLVVRAVRAALASRAKPVIVVTGHEAPAVEHALAGLDVRIVHNPDFAEGLSTSLKAGIAALPDDVDGAIVSLGDMPRIEARHLDRLISAFSPKEGRGIVVPVHLGKRGNPVLFARVYFPELLAIEGDTGARHIIAASASEVAEVDLATDAIFLDIDTPEALERAKEN